MAPTVNAPLLPPPPRTNARMTHLTVNTSCMIGHALTLPRPPGRSVSTRGAWLAFPLDTPKISTGHQGPPQAPLWQNSVVIWPGEGIAPMIIVLAMQRGAETATPFLLRSLWRIPIMTCGTGVHHALTANTS